MILSIDHLCCSENSLRGVTPIRHKGINKHLMITLMFHGFVVAIWAKDPCCMVSRWCTVSLDEIVPGDTVPVAILI